MTMSVDRIRKLLHSRTSAERLASMPRENREAYERIRKIREEIGPIDFNIVEALRESRGEVHEVQAHGEDATISEL